MNKLLYYLTSLLLSTSLLAAATLDSWPADAVQAAPQEPAVQTLQVQPAIQRDLSAPSLQNAVDRIIRELASQQGSSNGNKALGQPIRSDREHTDGLS